VKTSPSRRSTARTASPVSACATAFYFRYEQPELINTKEEIVKGLGSVKVQWTFTGSKIGCEFAYTVKQQVTLDKFRYVPRDRGPALEIPRQWRPRASARKAIAAPWPRTTSKPRGAKPRLSPPTRPTAPTTARFITCNTSSAIIR
jgi:hypothetical protein